jgi:hypothetical protein
MWGQWAWVDEVINLTETAISHQQSASAKNIWFG